MQSLRLGLEMTCADTSDSVSGLTLTTGVRSTRLPRGFCHLIVDENGRVADSLTPTLDMLATPDLQGVVNAFTNRLEASPETFRARLHFRHWPEMRLAWHAVHGSAGVGELIHDGQHRARTMLLLSGTDEAADVAAIRSLETTLGRSG